MNTRLYETLVERGYIYQTTNEENVKNMLNGKPICAYVGVDPTADSLHLGHCMPLILARYLQEAGHKIIVVLGGATAMVGDPSGKSDMRKMISEDFVEKNRPGIEKCIGKFLKLDGENPVTIVNNATWFKGYDYINFMRDIGKHFNINQMLACDAYKKRLENGGLTFLEMGYMPMQAYDFVELNRRYGCVLEFGGSDQWANICAGADLARKLAIEEGKENPMFEAFTNCLLLNADGVKMGKTEKGAVWVDGNKFSPYDFYQYFYNTDDRDVEKLLKLLTYIPLDKIATVMKGDIRDAKKFMAFEITKLVHGEEEAIKAKEASEKVFSQGYADNMPEVTLNKAEIGEKIGILDLLVLTGLTSSKGEAKRLIAQNGLSLNGEKVTDVTLSLLSSEVDGAVIQKGKKQFVKVVLK